MGATCACGANEPLFITDNAALSGLDGCTRSEGIFVSGPDITDLSAFPSTLTRIDGPLEIQGTGLTTLDGLQSLGAVETIRIFANQELSSIAALNLTQLSFDIEIFDNPLLPECDATELCADFPNAQCSVFGNGACP